MKNEPHKAAKTDPDSIPSAPRPGPGYDPMDRIVQELQNIQSFLSHLNQYPNDLNYLDLHESQILGSRRAIGHQLDQLAEEPYNYTASRLTLLKKENAQIFSYIEGAIGAMAKSDLKELKKFVNACEKIISKFDDGITP